MSDFTNRGYNEAIQSVIENHLKYGEYATVTWRLNSGYVTQFIRSFITDDIDKIKDFHLDTIESIIKASKVLYDLNWSRSYLIFKLLPDELYDNMLERYKSIRGSEPFQSHIPSGMRDAPHDFPELVGTLDKAYEVRDISDKMSVEKFLRKTMKELDCKTLRLAIGLKYDGSSISSTFDVATLVMFPVKATSRGDFEGNKGVDMSNLVSGRSGLSVIGEPESNIMGIQYEAMVTEKGRKKLSEITGVNYKTRRAAIAAAIKRIVVEGTSSKNNVAELNECVSLVPLNVNEDFLDESNMSWFDAMEKISSNAYYGEIQPNQSVIEGDLESLLADIQTHASVVAGTRSSLPYSIDGLVISVIDESLRRKLGRANNKNRWQIAYKFNAMVQRTHVTGIISTHGRSNFVGHNITFDPIEFNGVVYDKAPVNTVARFDGLDLRIGDEVLVSYNADVMGYIYKDETCSPNKDGKRVKLPEVCMHCGTVLIPKRDMLKCENEECFGEHIGRILEVIRILDIDFFGEETAEALASLGITNAIDFIQMDKETLGKVLKGKNLDKAYEQFQKKIRAEIDYSKVIDLLRIPALRTKTARKIIDHIGITRLMFLIGGLNLVEFVEALKAVPGVDKNAHGFAEGLITKQGELAQLMRLLNVIDADKPSFDKMVLISGFRSNPEFEEICNRLNYGITDSGKYDILVVTADRISGTKAKAAIKSGKPMYTLLEFIELNK